MIDPQHFWHAWQRICKRFNRQADMAEASDYLSYLELAGYDTARALAAAHAVWASREFFPRPVDFLEHEGLSAWPAFQEMANLRPPQGMEWREGAYERFNTLHRQIGPRAWAALSEIGGLDALKNTDPNKTRRDFLRAFSAHLYADDFNKVLGKSTKPLALPGGDA